MSFPKFLYTKCFSHEASEVKHTFSDSGIASRYLFEDSKDDRLHNGLQKNEVIVRIHSDNFFHSPSSKVEFAQVEDGVWKSAAYVLMRDVSRLDENQ